MKVLVKPIALDELSGVARLYEELTGRPTDLGKMEQSFSWMQSNPDYVVLGAKLSGVMVGTLLGIVCRDILGECRPFMVVENVVVSGSQRRQGVGKALMEKIEEIATERNCLYIMFVSSSVRTDAHQFYESIGYQSDFVQGFKKYL
jgi:GNAT superfamily N-acetyltransferase